MGCNISTYNNVFKFPYLIPFKFRLPLIFTSRGAKIGGSELQTLKIEGAKLKGSEFGIFVLKCLSVWKGTKIIRGRPKLKELRYLLNFWIQKFHPTPLHYIIFQRIDHSNQKLEKKSRTLGFKSPKMAKNAEIQKNPTNPTMRQKKIPQLPKNPKNL